LLLPLKKDTAELVILTNEFEKPRGFFVFIFIICRKKSDAAVLCIQFLPQIRRLQDN
jgi:hypothetical protein